MKKSEGVVMREKNTKLSLSCAAFLFLCMLACAVCVASAKTIYVPDDYEKIQWAVDNASAGDTIIVRDGVYVENIDINKPLTIKSENGSANCVVKAANSNDHVFYVTADNVIISGFTVTGATVWWDEKAGIFLYNSNNCRIEKCKILNNSIGIFLTSSSNNIIANNTASNNGDGICVEYSGNNIIASNIISNNGYAGIHSEDSSSNIIANNTISSDGCVGIFFVTNCNSNIIMNNIVSNNDDGIHFTSSSSNIIANNTVSLNDHSGIRFWYSSSNIIVNNTVSNNGVGIFLEEYSSSNIIYLNNFIDNTDQVYSHYSTKNIWNSAEKITYTYNGSQYTNYLGNYWSDYTGSDADEDGIGDTPYSIDGDKDNYPLMERFENYFKPVENQPPIASFTYSTDGLLVSFTSTSHDPDGDIVSYHWNFGDGATSTEKIQFIPIQHQEDTS